MSFIKRLREIVGWVLTRFNKGYALVGSIVNAFNFAGIFTLLLSKTLNVSQMILFPVLFCLGIIGILSFSVIVYDKANFQTILNEKNGELDDYWKRKLSPVQIKAYSLFVDMNEAVIENNKEKLDLIRKKLESGYI